MSIVPVSIETRDPFGMPIPGIVMYVSDYEQTARTLINAAIIHGSTRDYAKELLDRVRYLREAYTIPYAPGGTSPNTQAFSDAEAFIMKLPLNQTGLPLINVASDGEVNFDWSNGLVQIDLGFFGNGTYSFYARGSVQNEISGDDIPVDAELPGGLVEIASATG